MNAMAAGRGWRDMAIWVMPAAVYALASDTLIGVVRAWALARMHATGPALTGEEVTPLAVAGACLLWLLRLALAPVSTLAGFRRWVVEECPVAPGRTAAPQLRRAAGPAARRPPRRTRRRADGKPRKQDLLIALASQRHDLQHRAAEPGRPHRRRHRRRGGPAPRHRPPRPARPRPSPPAPRPRHQRDGSHAMKIAALIAAAGLVLIVIKWAFLHGRRLPRHRTRYLRIRLRLRLHPGKGHATLFELWWRWGRFAAFRHARHTRPSLGTAQRLLAPASEYSITAGRAHYRHALRLPLDEHVAIFSPPRGGKTGWLARVILHYPGPVLSTTTKHDVFALTSGIRAERGPVHVFNPQGVGGVPSTFRWNPLDGCQDPAVAIRRADAFANSVSQRGVEDASFWAAKASDYLRGYFHAAALAGLDLRHVAAWVSGTRPEEPEDILYSTAGAATHLADQLAEMRGEANKTISTVRMTMSRALAFLADPAPGGSRPARTRPVPGHPRVPPRDRHACT